jgi:hypothetical protein
MLWSDWRLCSKSFQGARCGAVRVCRWGRILLDTHELWPQIQSILPATVSPEGHNVQPKELTLGVDAVPPTTDDLIDRVGTLRATIEKYLPDFARGVSEAVQNANGEDGATMVLHQDAFAAGYDDDECMLLGMAIKYAGLHGVTVNIIGKNHDTF